MKKILIVSLILLAVAVSAYAEEKEATLEFEGRYWFAEWRGHLEANGEVRGTDLSLQRDLDLGNNNFPEGRITWYTGPRSRLFLDAVWSNNSGERTLDRTITVRDRTFTVGARVSSELKVQEYRFAWIWEFVHIGDGLFQFGTMLDVRAVSASFSVDGALNNLSQHAEASQTFPVPSLGLAFDLNPLKWMNLYIQGSGVPGGSYGYFINGETGIKIIPFKNFSIVGGYRYEDFNAKNTHVDIQGSFRLIGPFAGLSLRF
ncbi:MAG TPA: hypothetical protein VFA47_04190 [Candidatus Manganitrophaceae bacterium]|nr:hypothetical protein [Candidatus Manganitrophaceae bacterium]